MKTLVECVPNFSQGRDIKIIERIRSSIEQVNHIQLLHVDRGFDANRTVITFVGNSKSVLSAAFAAIRTATELIDMRNHSGVHPRLGATDVCPLIPLGNTLMDECIHLARNLGKQVGNELKIPVYLYEHAALRQDRRDLALIRRGEYEGLEDKMKQDQWRPDFGPGCLNPKSGAIAIGARPILIAYNINLNTQDKTIADDIAATIRESGKHIINKDASVTHVQGRLKACKAIGWMMKSYHKAQVSTNLTDYTVTSMHDVFEVVKHEAQQRHVQVTGSELIGLCPLEALLEAGRFYLKRDSDKDHLIQTAIDRLGLNEITPFDPDTKIIERRIRIL